MVNRDTLLLVLLLAACSSPVVETAVPESRSHILADFDGNLLLQFNAHNADGTRGFARECVQSPAAWKFNTYNRMAFWMKNPPQGAFGVVATGNGGWMPDRPDFRTL